MKNTLITITGPSCAGKSTLEKLLVKKGFNRLVSTTTRPMRQGERQGDAYHFCDHAAFDSHLTRGEFVEFVNYNSHLYGVLANDVFSALDKGNAVVVVEPKGKAQFNVFAEKHGLRVLNIFVTNPQTVILERFLTRFGEDYVLDQAKAVETYAKRLITMQSEEVTWHFDANSEHYDLVFDEFCVTSVVPVMQAIMRRAGLAEETAVAA